MVRCKACEYRQALWCPEPGILLLLFRLWFFIILYLDFLIVSWLTFFVLFSTVLFYYFYCRRSFATFTP